MSNDNDDEEYEFDYSDEDDIMDDDTGDLHVQIENQYYAAKQYLESEPPERERALAALAQVVAMQVEKTDWGFKALKRIVKLEFALGQHVDAMKQYEVLLGYTKSDVTDKARSDFFEGFKNYDEAGEPRCLQCLKYLVLANMLSEAHVNVFDSQEAKPYEHDSAIVAMTQLTDAFLHDEIKTFERVLALNQATVMADPFVKHHIDRLLRTIRSKVLVKIVKPYKTMDTRFIATELNGIAVSEVESLLSALVLDQKIHARIDQVNHTLVLFDRKVETKFQDAVVKWCDSLETLHALTVDRVSTSL